MATGKKSKNSAQRVSATTESLVVDAIDASFPIVGIGASAGGLAAFEAFFSGMPLDAEPGAKFL